MYDVPDMSRRSFFALTRAVSEGRTQRLRFFFTSIPVFTITSIAESLLGFYFLLVVAQVVIVLLLSVVAVLVFLCTKH